MENETNQLLGRLETVNGKIWLKFLPSVTIVSVSGEINQFTFHVQMRQLSGSSIHSDDLPSRENMFIDQVKSRDIPNRKATTSTELIIPTKPTKTTVKSVPSYGS